MTTAILTNLITTSGLMAQESQELERLRACAEMTNSAKRHACYDAVLRSEPEETSAPAAPSAATVQPAQPTQVQPSAPMPPIEATPEVPEETAARPSQHQPVTPDVSERDTLAQFGLPTPVPEIEAIQITVQRVTRNAYDKFTFYTTDGQVWTQTDRARSATFHVPFTAEIRRASAGSFFLRPDDGNAAMRVRRKK